MLSSLTQVVRHIDSLTIDYQRQSTFEAISLASSKSAGRCSRRRNPVQANWCSVVLGVVNNLAVLAQTSRVPFGRVSMFADCPGAFQFSPPKGSITRGAQTRTAAAALALSSSPRSTRDAARQSRGISSLQYHQTAKQTRLKISRNAITCRLHHLNQIIILAQRTEQLTAFTRIPLFTHA